MSRFDCSFLNKSFLKRINHSDVNCSSILSCFPTGDIHISRAPIVAREEVAALLGGVEGCSCCSVMEGIPEGIVARDSFTLVAAAHSIVPESITVPVTAWGGSSSVIHLASFFFPMN